MIIPAQIEQHEDIGLTEARMISQVMQSGFETRNNNPTDRA